MPGFLVILLPALGVVSAAVFVFVFLRRGRGDKKKHLPISRDRQKAIRQAKRRLAQNPADAESLGILAELYLQEGDHPRARESYDALLRLCPNTPELDEFEITTKLGIVCLKLKDYREAYKNFVVARNLKGDSAEVNYYLGYLEFLRKRYDIAAELLRRAFRLQPDRLEYARYLGLSLARLRRYSQAAEILNKVIEEKPDDKEAQFALAQCFYEQGSSEKALKAFSHLRADPHFGPRASLYAGSINVAGRQYAEAILDLEIGLRHSKMSRGVRLELQYRLASVCLQQKQISKGLSLLKGIVQYDPSYKNAGQLIEKYQELSANESLQTYLLGEMSDFSALCRKIASSFFPKAVTRLTDISMANNEYVDVLAEVDAGKWQDSVLFRFSRSSSTIGELALREMYARVRDVRAGRAFYLSAGDYSEQARRFVEARLIDLVDKEQLIKLFGRLDSAESPAHRA